MSAAIIDGKEVAKSIKQGLRPRIEALRVKEIVPVRLSLAEKTESFLSRVFAGTGPVQLMRALVYAIGGVVILIAVIVLGILISEIPGKIRLRKIRSLESVRALEQSKQQMLEQVIRRNGQDAIRRIQELFANEEEAESQ